MPDDEPMGREDRVWWKPEPDRSLIKMFNEFGMYLYRLSCLRCDVSWIGDMTEDHPRCFACGRFVKTTESYRKERARLREKGRRRSA